MEVQGCKGARVCLPFAAVHFNSQHSEKVLNIGIENAIRYGTIRVDTVSRTAKKGGPPVASDWGIEHEPLFAKVADALRTMILDQTLPPGTRLVQEEIAEKFSVSRMPIRDALKQLALEGLIELDARKGAVVAGVTIDQFQEVYTLRALNEPVAYRLSAPHLTESEVGRLHEWVERMGQYAKQGATESFAKVNKEFHRLLRAHCPWPRMNRLIDSLWVGLPPYTPVFVADQAMHSQLEHERMTQAIGSQDWELLERIAREHIERSRDALIDHLVQGGYLSGD